MGIGPTCPGSYPSVVIGTRKPARGSPTCLHTWGGCLGTPHPPPQEAEAGWSEHPSIHMSWYVVALTWQRGSLT